MDAAQRKEKIELYGRGYDQLSATLDNIPKEMWQFKPEPTAWSVHEIIIHLADSETNSSLRARQFVAQPGAAVMAFDQDVWANKLDYHQQDWQDALEILRLTRKSTYELLITLPEDVWTNSVIHPEIDQPFRFERWLEIYSGHIPSHIEQINNNHKLWLASQA
ncbi:MAG: DinB family protein [Chloroflexi bacterium]|nr:MAG: DinB family protein [Chloroflexota bacterium]MBL1196330.1 DinB family protein [Chloroflexota bacterium]NOH13625.1 DinB family protein [Chloroflexota bacterium]